MAGLWLLAGGGEVNSYPLLWFSIPMYYNYRMNLYSILMVGLGGFFGSAARYVAVKLVDSRLSSALPYGTLLVNFSGSLIVGIVAGIALKTSVSDYTRLLLVTGFCGGFTTFSAFAFENVNLLQQKLMATAFVYTGLSLLAGFAGVVLGMYIGRSINP